MKKVLSLLFIVFIITAVGCETDDSNDSNDSNDSYTCSDAAENVYSLSFGDSKFFKGKDKDGNWKFYSKDVFIELANSACKGEVDDERVDSDAWPQDYIDCVATSESIPDLVECDAKYLERDK